MSEQLIPPRGHTGFEDALTEDLYEIVGQQVFAGVTGGPWDLAVIDFAILEHSATVRYQIDSEDNAATLSINRPAIIRRALSELCFRMDEAGHGWNVATYRLTSDGAMNIKFGLREDPWELGLRDNYVD